jgi:hypothetical protein
MGIDQTNFQEQAEGHVRSHHIAPGAITPDHVDEVVAGKGEIKGKTANRKLVKDVTSAETARKIEPPTEAPKTSQTDEEKSAAKDEAKSSKASAPKTASKRPARSRSTSRASGSSKP